MTGAARILGDATRLPTLVNERTVLRWIERDEAGALFDIFGDPHVCRYWSREALPDVTAAQALQREIEGLFADRSLLQWGIAERTTDALIGTCTLAGMSPEHGRAEVGFALRQDVWGRGYATEALGALVRLAFTDLRLRRLDADADPRNVASIRVLERVGFRREGLQRERHVMNGEVQDAVLFGLLRREWEPAGRS